MFEKIRKPGRAKNIVSYVIFGLICLVFVFIGVPLSQFSGMGGGALVVNNKVISWSEYKSYLEMLEQRAQGSTGRGLEAQRQEQLRRQAIDTLLSTELMIQEAQKSGFVVSKKAVQDKIVEIPFFQEEGRFMHSKYRSFLEARRFSASYFESLIRKEIQTVRFQNVFNLTVHTSKAEKARKQKLDSFKLQVSYIQFASGDLSLEELNNITTVVQEGDLAILNDTIKTEKWNWEKVNAFNLNRISLPDFESQKILFDAVLNQLPNVGVIKKVIGVRDKSFILKIDSFDYKEEKKSALTSDLFGNMMVARMVFLNWMRSARTSSEIKFSPRLQDIAQ